MSQLVPRRSFRELDELERLIEGFGPLARHRVLDDVEYDGKRYPLHAIILGQAEREAPTLAFFGGVHGLEKIGSEIVISYMRTALNLLQWDRTFQDRLARTRIVFFPIVNPVGIAIRRRANGNRVDLMRNAPIDAAQAKGLIYPGHRISRYLPFYRGPEGAAMELEARAIMKLLDEEVFSAKICMSVDVHSGFGAMDRFWFPFSTRHEAFPFMPETHRLKQLFDQTYPNHFYAIEPTSKQYVIHGDLWDFLFQRHQELHPGRVFIPWTLEIGSWIWLKKNPMQIFSPLGPWHPIRPHRHSRILRRHLTLFEFLHRALDSNMSWTHLSAEKRAWHEQEGQRIWYGKR